MVLRFFGFSPRLALSIELVVCGAALLIVAIRLSRHRDD